MPLITPLVRNLLILNVLIFFLQSGTIIQLFALFPVESPLFKPHQFISYMFLHANGGHLFSNMLGLFFFGPILEQMVLGQKRFLIFYFVTGIGAGLLFSAINYYELWQMQQSLAPDLAAEVLRERWGVPMLGASGAVFGIIAAFGLIFPNMEMMLLFLPVPIKAKYLVTFYALYELYGGIYVSNSGIAHFAHIGGMIFAYFLLKWWNINRMN
ncbi:MAG: rhomboid family intramembrane serine protease [Spirosomaceae bacterium]|jgi:membrane associated rhomboid family serine protease|nr:rhomboid family intramembrane serine protease [Spirosomataceae bacterium]